MRFIKGLRAPAVALLAMTLICGVVYTAAVTGIGQALFGAKADGSLITVTLKDGSTRVYGSELIAQEFTAPQYMIGRPSAVSNLGPSSAAQAKLVQARVEWWHAFDPTNTAPIPQDLVTASGSGVDPYISPEAAEYQVARIAAARGISPDAVRAVIARHTKPRFVGVLGEPGVNVLLVNLDLDGLI